MHVARCEPGAGDPPGGSRAVPARPVHECRHGRVPLLAGDSQLLLHGGERPSPGRAPGHRADHRPRSGQAADRGGPGRATSGCATGGRVGSCHRGAPERRGSGQPVRAGARSDPVVPAAGRSRHPRRHRRRRGRRNRGRVRLDDRQGPGMGARPGGGAGTPGAGAVADPGHRRRRTDEQGLPPHTPRTSRRHRRPLRHRMDRRPHGLR